MKKLLTLLLILGLASLASATLQISVDGDKEPVDSEIMINPSDELTLDIWTDSAIDTGDAGTWIFGYALVVDPADGTITGGTVLEPFLSDGGYAVYGPAIGYGYYPGPEDGVGGSMTPTGTAGNAAAGDTIIDLITFHCVGPDDATILLYVTDDFVTYNLADSVVIHQPEPMTIALLSLGGLFLRRRK